MAEIAQVSNWQLEAVQVIPKDGEPFDVHTAHLETINIFEGMSKPGLGGSMTIKDYDAILEVQEIFAGDEINISIKSKGKSAPLSFIGKIFAVEQQVSGQHKAPITKFNFCTEWWFNAITKQVSMVWKDKTVEEMLEDIIVNVCGAESWQGMYPAPTKKIERLVTPYWTPAHIIKYLLSYAYGDDGEAGYVLWDSLVEQQPICMSLGHVLDRQFAEEPNELLLNSPNVQNAGSFNNLWVESIYDEMRYLNQGMFQNNVIAFDYDRNKPYKSEGDVTQVNSGHLAHQIPIRQSAASDEYESFKISRSFPNTQHPVSESVFQNAVDAYRNNRYQMVFSDMVKMNTMVPGDTGRRAGSIVKVNFPSINRMRGTDERHKMLEGHYLIRNIQHVLTYSSFIQVMTLSADGINMTDRTDLKKWNS